MTFDMKGMCTMKKTLITIALTATFCAGTVLAQDHSAVFKARQGQMRLLALNLGILGGMAKGEMEYNAELAQAAAGNVATVANLSQATIWPEGTGMDAIKDSTAKANIWTDFAGFQEKWNALAPAAEKLQAAAGQGPAEIGAAIGAVGGTCKGCHDTYRAPKE